MNPKLLWTATAFLTTALSTPSVGLALDLKPVGRTDQQKSLKATSTHPLPSTPTINATTVAPVAPTRSPFGGGNYIVIARVQPHALAGRMAATLLVRNIPVLTFVGESAKIANSSQAGVNGSESGSKSNDEFQQLNAPIKRAQAVAASLNQMYANNVDASTIKAVLESGETVASKSNDKIIIKSQSDRYLIKVKDTVLVEIDSTTRLPDTINNHAKDALLATNRLRQLMGNAPPLGEISGKAVSLPKDKFLEEISLGPVQIHMSGLASWYNFGENGSETASGESFNDNQLTAAHLTLPFGTQVRVTNILNGHSVVVRINDRGPYIPGRMIDLSTAAATLLGMIEPGVVPVNVDVLGRGTPVERGVSVGVGPAKKQDSTQK